MSVQAHPIPTAQITIFLFHDNFPINNVPDLPEETNPAVGEPGHVDWTQFSLFLEEPAGRYGQAGGQVIQDAFGNPLGTEYDPATGDPLTGPGGCPARADGTCADGTLYPNPGRLSHRQVPVARQVRRRHHPSDRSALAADRHHRRHAGDRCLGEGQRAALLRRVRPPGRAMSSSDFSRPRRTVAFRHSPAGLVPRPSRGGSQTCINRGHPISPSTADVRSPTAGWR